MFHATQISKLHSSSVKSVAWSSDSKSIVSVGHDTRMHVSSLSDDNGNDRAWTAHDDNSVFCTAWSPCSDQIVTGSFHNAKVWFKKNDGSWYCGRVLDKHDCAVTGVAWSRDGCQIASCSFDHKVCVWFLLDNDTPHVAFRHKTNKEFSSVAFSPNTFESGEQRVVAGGFDKNVHVLSVTKNSLLGLLVLNGHTDKVRSVAWSPNGLSIASASDDCSVRIWIAASGQPESLITLDNPVMSVAWAPDSNNFCCGTWNGGGHDTVSVWSRQGNEWLQKASGSKTFTNSVAWSPDGKHIAFNVQDGLEMWSF